MNYLHISLDMKKLLGEESTPPSPLEARAAVLAQLRARALSRRKALQCCTHAAHAALHLLAVHTRRLRSAALRGLDDDGWYLCFFVNA